MSDDQTRRTTHTERTATTVAAVAFVLATLGAVGFVLAYVLLEPGGTQNRAFGASLVVALGGIGVGLVVWAHSAMPEGPHVEPRHAPKGDPEARAAAADSLATGAEGVGRRSLLGRLLAGALGALGLSALTPLASLGPRPLPEDVRTGWERGLRLVREDGSPVRRDDVPVGGAIAAYPEDVGRRADSQVMLIRLAEDGQVELDSARTEWTVAGHVAYSRLCTHMGCSVGLYQAETRSLVCPCHQSAFMVVEGARPQFGPATRSLPQLPLALDDEGHLVADGDFDRPVGTASWRHPERAEEKEA